MSLNTSHGKDFWSIFLVSRSITVIIHPLGSKLEMFARERNSSGICMIGFI